MRVGVRPPTNRLIVATERIGHHAVRRRSPEYNVDVELDLRRGILRFSLGGNVRL